MNKIFVKKADGSYEKIDESDILPGSIQPIYENGRLVGYTFIKESDYWAEMERQRQVAIKEFNELRNQNELKKLTESFTYLIEQGNYYKIGFTVNIKSRIKSYETHNVDFKPIGYLRGNFEKELQNKFKQYQYKNEWFHKNDEILNEFINRGMEKYE